MLINVAATLRVTPADGATLLDLLALAHSRGFADAVEEDGAIIITVAMEGVPT